MLEQRIKKIAFYPTAVVLVAVNLIILAQVLFFGLDNRMVLLLFWSETGIIGFYTIVKILTLPVYGKTVMVKTTQVLGKKNVEVSWVPKSDMKLPVAVILFVSLGGFMILHLFLLSSIFLNQNPFSPFNPYPGDLSLIIAIMSSPTFLTSFFMLFLSHGVSFFVNYKGKQEYTLIEMRELIYLPESRVTLMQAALFLGCLFNTHVILLFLGKIVLDLFGHFTERKQFGPL